MTKTVTASSVPPEAASASPRGRPRSEEADRAIVEATIALLEEEGYEGLTMAGVAHRAGVSTATLYRRYSGKVELVLGALSAMKGEGDIVDTGSLEGDLRAMVADTCSVLNGSTGQLMRSLVGEMQRNEELAEAVRTRLVEHRVDAAQRVLGAAVARGEIDPPADPVVALDMFTGPFIIRHLLGTGDLTPAAKEQLVQLTLRMLGGDPRAARPSPARRTPG
jgi:AcrR family transcriptional regulator